VVVLRLERLLLRRVVQDVLAVDEDVDVAVLGQGVGLAGPAEIELPERRDHVVQVRVALLDVRVERQQIAVAREVADVGRIEHDQVDGLPTRDELGLLLAVDVGERHLDDLQLDARLLPLGRPEAEHVHVVARRRPSR